MPVREGSLSRVDHFVQQRRVRIFLVAALHLRGFFRAEFFYYWLLQVFDRDPSLTLGLRLGWVLRFVGHRCAPYLKCAKCCRRGIYSCFAAEGIFYPIRIAMIAITTSSPAPLKV